MPQTLYYGKLPLAIADHEAAKAATQGECLALDRPLVVATLIPGDPLGDIALKRARNRAPRKMDRPFICLGCKQPLQPGDWVVFRTRVTWVAHVTCFDAYKERGAMTDTAYQRSLDRMADPINHWPPISGFAAPTRPNPVFEF